MHAGFYYPMKIVHSNAVSWDALPISVELPDGTTVSDDFAAYVYSFDDYLSQSICTVPDPSEHTTSIITTKTEPWTGTFATTSTGMTTVTGTNGLPTDEIVIFIRTPTSEHIRLRHYHLSPPQQQANELPWSPCLPAHLMHALSPYPLPLFPRPPLPQQNMPQQNMPHGVLFPPQNLSNKLR